MSNLERNPAEALCGGRTTVAGEPVHQFLDGREVLLGPRNTLVTRTLPHRDRRMVGAWCFLDQYGPEDITGQPGMRVPPHPHTGLQTVSWLLAGDVLHRDSLGNRQLVRPGQLNLMTAGHGIAHSEESPADHPPVLHGVQLWVALPAPDRGTRPDFEHHARLPVWSAPGVEVSVFIGELDGCVSPARTYSPILGAEITLAAGSAAELPLRPDFEHAALGLSGAARVDGVALAPGPLLYLGTGRSSLPLGSGGGARVLLLGGEPFDELILMWWNFLGRSHDEIVEVRTEWMRGLDGSGGTRFGRVAGYRGEPLPAPALPATPLKPRPRRP